MKLMKACWDDTEDPQVLPGAGEVVKGIRRVSTPARAVPWLSPKGAGWRAADPTSVLPPLISKHTAAPRTALLF